MMQVDSYHAKSYEYDFTRLSAAQKRFLTNQGWLTGCGAKKPQRRTIEKLIKRRLVAEYYAPGGMCLWWVPSEAYIAWCQYCSDLEEAKARKVK